MKTHSRPLCMLPAAALAATLAACQRTSGQPAVDASPRAVRVASAQLVEAAQSVRVVGLLGHKDEARLAFELSGYIEAIPVREGQTVKAGQVLASLKQTEAAAAVEQAREVAAKAGRDLRRARALMAEHVGTDEEVENMQTAYRVANAALTTARFAAAHSTIVAPADGVILRKLADIDELVQGGQPVLAIGSAGGGWIVKTGLADRDAVLVAPGDAARVEFDAWPGEMFDGVITNVAAAADSASGTFTVEIRVEPGSAHFIQGLVAKVTLSLAKSGQHLLIPVQTLLEASGTSASVFVYDRAASRVRRLYIRVGALYGNRVEVVEGLSPGTEVVTDGAVFIQNGDRVRLAPAPDRSEPNAS